VMRVYWMVVLLVERKDALKVAMRVDQLVALLVEMRVFLMVERRVALMAASRVDQSGDLVFESVALKAD
jgi:hypothetical protein